MPAPDSATQAKADALQSRIGSAKNRFTKSKTFKDCVASAYVAVDADKSGKLNVDEVYVAVLMLYLKINGFCKGAVPPTRPQVEDLFEQFNRDNDPEMDQQEFQDFCEVMCSQILTRVVAQFLLQTVGAPLLGLLALKIWTEIMERVAPLWFHWCDEHIPAPLVITIVVGASVGMLVPPVMRLVDKYVVSELGMEAKDAATLEQQAIAKRRRLRGSFLPTVYEVGERVQMKDNSDDQWYEGYVTSSDPLKVRMDGGKPAFSWEQVRHTGEGGWCCVARPGKG